MSSDVIVMSSGDMQRYVDIENLQVLSTLFE